MVSRSVPNDARSTRMPWTTAADGPSPSKSGPCPTEHLPRNPEAIRLTTAAAGQQSLWITGSAHVPGPGHHVFRRGQLRKAHRAAGVQLLRRDADLRAESELAAVDEPGGRVDEDGGGVHCGNEGTGGAL